jgi:hypothetical protein
MNGTISGNTTTGAASGYDSSHPNLEPDDMDGGGGVYIKGNANFYLDANGTIANNTTKGAGGGVLVNGNKIGPSEYGLFMTGGRIANNTSTSWVYPHGGGGVYVAHGAFEMVGGEVTTNAANRQGGGVFVHWGEARFNASGNATITGNSGVGSSAAICNRGITEMMDNARADRVYVWDYDASTQQTFTLAKNARVGGVVLAYSAGNRSIITIANSILGTDQIGVIDLESHLNSDGLFAGQLEADWLGKKIITGANTVISQDVLLGRLPLNTFTGTPSVYDLGKNYKINVAAGATVGTFVKK